MKKRTRILSVLMCGAMIAGLTACGGVDGGTKDAKDDGGADGKIKLTFSTSVYVE